MSEFNEDETYILTAPRCRPSWRVPENGVMMTYTKRLKRGEKIEGIPAAQVRRLVEMGHAVPESEYDPAKLRKISAARRLAMNSAAAADARAAVAAANQSSGLPLVGLEDADEVPDAPTTKEGAVTGTTPQNPGDGPVVDDIVSEDIDGVKQPEDADDDEDLGDTGVGRGQGDGYESMSYPELVQAAKAKTNNGGGTKEELITRLREHDANQ